MNATTLDGSALSSDRPMRILNETLRQRLDAVTAVQRLLSAMGYTVVRQDLRLGDERRRPILTLQAGDERLRSALSQIQIGITDDGRALIGRYLGVDITWPLDAQRDHH
jgi:hypothetical protein